MYTTIFISFRCIENYGFQQLFLAESKSAVRFLTDTGASLLLRHQQVILWFGFVAADAEHHGGSWSTAGQAPAGFES